jgi:hypothetical protein
VESNSRNPYAPPGAPVERDERAAVGSSGSLEDAVAGRYDFSIGDIMREAWDLVPGFKAPFWGATVLIYLVFLVIAIVGGLIGGGLGDGQPPLWLQIVNGLAGIVLSPLFVGLIAMATRHACGMPVSFSLAFRYIRRAPVIIGAALLVTLLTYVGFLLLLIPGIYLAFAYGMTLPLVAFNDLGIWRAMETSRRAITHHWFGFFGLYFAVSILVTLSALLLLIPLIWTLPWAMLVFGVAYRRMFGAPPLA